MNNNLTRFINVRIDENNDIWLSYYKCAYIFEEQIACVNKSNYRQKQVIAGMRTGKLHKNVEDDIKNGKQYYVSYLLTEHGFDFVAFDKMEDAIAAVILIRIIRGSIVSGHFNPETDTAKLYFDSVLYKEKDCNFIRILCDVFESGKYSDISDFVDNHGYATSYCEPYKEFDEPVEETSDEPDEPEMTMKQVFEKMVGHDHDEFEKQVNKQFGELTGIW